MATIFSHAIAAGALTYALPLPGVEKTKKFYAAAAVVSVVPDLDVVGFAVGINYADFLGHRGFSHSVVFALMTGIVTALLLRYKPGDQAFTFTAAFMALATFSHGILDAFTNGGLGVALFSPFYNERIFFSYTPIEVSPIGLRFFSPAGLQVILSEVIWIWAPCLWIVLLSLGIKALIHRHINVGKKSTSD